MMTSLGTCASIGAAAFPKWRKALLPAFVFFAAAAAYSYYRAIGGGGAPGAEALSARDVLLTPFVLVAFPIALCGLLVALARIASYTSAGITVRKLENSDDWRPVIEVKPSGSELPQPLHIKVETGALLTEVTGQYSDPSGLTSGLKTTIKGKCAIIELEQPKLQAPGKLTIVVSGPKGEALDIKSVKRRRSP